MKLDIKIDVIKPKAVLPIEKASIKDCVDLFEGGAKNIYFVDQDGKYQGKVANRKISKISANGAGRWTLSVQNEKGISYEGDKVDAAKCMKIAKSAFSGKVEVTELPIVAKRGKTIVALAAKNETKDVRTMNWELFKGMASEMPKGKILISSLDNPLLKSFFESWQYLLDLEILTEENFQKFLSGKKEGILLYGESDIFPECRKVNIHDLYDQMQIKMEEIVKESSRGENGSLFSGGGYYNFQHQLSVVAIMQNEGPYLREWLDYHILAGVDYFYLYDHDSTDDTLDVLSTYIQAGWVQCKNWPVKPGVNDQKQAYRDALKEYRFESKWMTFIDLDEFILPLKKNKSILEVLEETLEGHKNAKGLCINWRMYGSSGHKVKPSGGVLKNFCYRAAAQNRHVKTIFNPRFAYDSNSPHNVRFYANNYSMNDNGDKILYAWNGRKSLDRICINHYYLKSWEEWKERRGRAQVDNVEKNYDGIFLNVDKSANKVYDETILCYRTSRLDMQVHKRIPNKKESVLTVTESMHNVGIRMAREIASGYLTLTAEELFCYWNEWILTADNDARDDVEKMGCILLCQLLQLGKVSLGELELFFDLIMPTVNKRELVERFLVPGIKFYIERLAGKVGAEWGNNLRLTAFITGAVRVRLLGNNNCYAQVNNKLSDCPVNIRQGEFPDGALVLGNAYEMYLTVKCKGTGELNIVCQGISAHDKRSVYIPLAVKFTSVQYNNFELLAEPVEASQVHPYVYKKQVKDGERVDLIICWHPVDYEPSTFLQLAERICSK